MLFCQFAAAFAAEAGIAADGLAAKGAYPFAFLRISGVEALGKTFSDEADHIADEANFCGDPSYEKQQHEEQTGFMEIHPHNSKRNKRNYGYCQTQITNELFHNQLPLSLIGVMPLTVTRGNVF